MIKRLKRNTIYQDEWLSFYQDEVQFPDGSEGTYGLVHRKNGVGIVVVTPDHKILLNKEYRYVLEKYFWEIPGGGIDEGEKPEDAARRELLEETGIQAETLEELGAFYPLNSFNTESITLFMTIVAATRPTTSGNEESEDVKEQKYVSFSEALEMIDSGHISDTPTANALQLVIRRFHPPLTN